MATLEELKKQLAEKQVEFRNYCDLLLLSGTHSAEADKKREEMKAEMQKLNDRIIELDDSDDSAVWDVEAEEENAAGL